MNVVYLMKKDPEERHLNRYPKGREGICNVDSNPSFYPKRGSRRNRSHNSK